MVLGWMIAGEQLIEVGVNFVLLGQLPSLEAQKLLSAAAGAVGERGMRAFVFVTCFQFYVCPPIAPIASPLILISLHFGEGRKCVETVSCASSGPFCIRGRGGGERAERGRRGTITPSCFSAALLSSHISLAAAATAAACCTLYSILLFAAAGALAAELTHCSSQDLCGCSAGAPLGWALVAGPAHAAAVDSVQGGRGGLEAPQG
eukprot:776533-Pelagomonas_calceolata.AAC.4